MGFDTELQSQSSHESLLKLQDTEIRLLETIKKCVTQRVKCDRDYAQSLTALSNIAGKFDNPENFSSPLFKVSLFLKYLSKIFIDCFLKSCEHLFLDIR